MKRWMLGILTWGWALWAQGLVIPINQGQDKPFPIALVPFSGPELNLPSLPEGFNTVILDDLGSSGRFDLLNKTQMPEFPHQAAQVHSALWQKADPQTEYLIVGSLKKEGQDYGVSYEVVSLFNGDVIQGQKFQDIPPGRLRSLAHFIADNVYQSITGDRGYFSTRFAFVSVEGDDPDTAIYRLMISDADGFHPQVLLQQLGNPIASPVWSPDGKSIAYVSYREDRMAIYTITLATGQRHLIANFNGINSAPAFSPDGKTLAMALSFKGSSDTNLYLYRLGTHHLHQLTFLGTNTSPSFAPDGQSIVYNSDRSGTPQIYLLSLLDGQSRLLTTEGVQNFSPQFLSNGQDIVFMHQEVREGPINIAVMNIPSLAFRVLTQGQLDKSPSPAPNGQMILYANFDGPRGVLAEVSIDGRIHAQLPASQGSVQSPAWSPFLT